VSAVYTTRFYSSDALTGMIQYAFELNMEEKNAEDSSGSILNYGLGK
jgi:hypothetical protein